MLGTKKRLHFLWLEARATRKITTEQRRMQMFPISLSWPSFSLTIRKEPMMCGAAFMLRNRCMKSKPRREVALTGSKCDVKREV
jgi:hypothetical protein